MPTPVASETFDLIVIGGGPAGYVAAIRAAQLGFKTACIDKRGAFGGTCLNVGCIPSKALLESSEHYYQAKTKFEKHGIQMGDLKVDLSQMMKRKDTVVRQLTQGILGLFKKRGVTPFTGTARLLPPGASPAGDKLVEISSKSGNQIISAQKILIATGSEPNELPFMKFDGKRILSSTEVLALSSIPKHLAVIGGGVIGLEMGSVWARLGARVTVIEFNERILTGVDQQTATELQKALTKQGLEFRLNTKCLGDDGKAVTLEDRSTQSKTQLECDIVLVATGRRPYTDGLGLENYGIALDKAGRVSVDTHFQSSSPGIYAVGDVIIGPMLAHKAEEEGIASVEIMAGQAGHVNYEAIPNIIYTWPELASVGASEEEVKSRGAPYRTGVFPFLANGRAKTMEEIEGFVKIIADEKTDRVLGVHIVGPRASDLIAEAVAVIEYGGSAEDIARTCHAHPTLAETVKEAAMAVDKRQIHL